MNNTIELKLINNNIHISGLHNFSDNIKSFISELENDLNIKSFKYKTKNEIECGLECNDIVKIKKYLQEKLNINEKLIKYEEPKENNDIKEKNNILDNINKKIKLHFVKEKRANRTYILGLKDFIKNDEFIILVKQIQKILGTNSNINENGDCGFNGDYTNDITKKNIIRDLLLKNTSISKDIIDF